MTDEPLDPTVFPSTGKWEGGWLGVESYVDAADGDLEARLAFLVHGRRLFTGATGEMIELGTMLIDSAHSASRMRDVVVFCRDYLHFNAEQISKAIEAFIAIGNARMMTEGTAHQGQPPKVEYGAHTDPGTRS